MFEICQEYLSSLIKTNIKLQSVSTVRKLNKLLEISFLLFFIMKVFSTKKMHGENKVQTIMKTYGTMEKWGKPKEMLIDF